MTEVIEQLYLQEPPVHRTFSKAEIQEISLPQKNSQKTSFHVLVRRAQ